MSPKFPPHGCSALPQLQPPRSHQLSPPTIYIASAELIPSSASFVSLHRHAHKPKTTTAETVHKTMSTEIASTPQHPSSTLVNISADADLRLIKLLAPTTSSPSQFESACSDHIANGDAAGLVKAIVAEEGAIGGLFSGEYTVEEAVGAVCLLGALLERVGDETMEGELCASLADVVARAAAASASNEDGSAEKGSACVAALFNLRSNGVEKVRLLTKIVDLADTSSLAPGAPEGYSALADMLESSMLQSSLTLWGGRNDDNSSIPDGEQRALFQAVVRGMDRVLAKLTGDKKGDEAASVEVEVARKIKAAVDRKQTYLMLILETYKEEVSGFAAEVQLVGCARYCCIAWTSLLLGVWPLL